MYISKAQIGGAVGNYQALLDRLFCFSPRVRPQITNLEMKFTAVDHIPSPTLDPGLLVRPPKTEELT